VKSILKVDLENKNTSNAKCIKDLEKISKEPIKTKQYVVVLKNGARIPMSRNEYIAY
jgi:hypothetical protein